VGKGKKIMRCPPGDHLEGEGGYLGQFPKRASAGAMVQGRVCLQVEQELATMGPVKQILNTAYLVVHKQIYLWGGKTSFKGGQKGRRRGGGIEVKKKVILGWFGVQGDKWGGMQWASSNRTAEWQYAQKKVVWRLYDETSLVHHLRGCWKRGGATSRGTWSCGRSR